METLTKNEYLHNGNSIIYKELWNKLYMNPLNHKYVKPIGGFWSTKYYESFSEWMDFLYYSRPEMYWQAKYKNNLIFKLNDETKILKLEDKNDYKNLKDSGFTKKLDRPIEMPNYFNYDTIYEIPDYYKIEELYDAIYVNPGADISLKTFAVNTMLVTNPNAIDYFKTIDLTFEEDQDVHISYMTVNSIGKKQKIKEVTEKYNKLVELIKKDFIKHLAQATNEEELISILEHLKNKYINNNNDIDYLCNGIVKYQIIYSIIHNLQVEHKDDIKKLIKK